MKIPIEKIQQLGFEKNSKNINGYRPNYRKENDLLFLLNASFGPRKIYAIGSAFKLYDGEVYGILVHDSPRAAAMDWVTATKVKLLSLEPLAIYQWKTDGTDIEFIEVTELH